MAFTEFCCRSGGSNLNAGTLLGDTTVPSPSASFVFTGGTFATNTFTLGSGDTTGVTAGMFCQVSDGSSIGRIAKIASVTSSTIVLDTTQSVVWNAGTYTECRVGGAWAGPNGASDAFPFTTASLSVDVLGTNASKPKINLKNDVDYGCTTAVTLSLRGTARSAFAQGFTSNYGDGGKAVILGIETGGSYAVLVGAAYAVFIDLDIRNNGATGSVDGVMNRINDARVIFMRCSASNMRGAGFSGTGLFLECEAFGNNTSNTAGIGGFYGGSGGGGTMNCVNCVSHGNLRHGFSIFFGAISCITCIASNNSESGFRIPQTQAIVNTLIHCDAYGNGLAGFDISSQFNVILNCNSAANGTYGFAGSNAANYTTQVIAALGTPVSGPVNLVGETDIANTTSFTLADNLSYAGASHVDALNSDFRLTGGVVGAGYGKLPIEKGGTSGGVNTVGSPDIGAAQSLSSGGGSGGNIIVVED